MSVQTKILLVLGAALAAGLAALATVLLVVVTPAFDRLDVEQAEKNVNRVQQTIANELAVLDQKAVDWAHWDDSYAFVQSGDVAFVTNNLQPSSLINLGVSFMAFYDMAGAPVWAGGFDPETEEAKNLAGLADPIQIGSITTARHGTSHGLLEIDGKTYLVSAIDVLDSNENGPAQGTLAVGKEIDDALLAELMARTEVQFTLHPFRATDTSLATPQLVGESATALMHRFTLSDMGGTPRLDIEIQTPRGASALGRNAVLLAGGLLVATVILIMVVIAVAINRMVVRPLHAVNSAMQEVARSADLEKRLTWRRRDEIGQLAAQFDRMLEQIAQARRELLEMTYRLGKSDLATGMLHNLRNALSPLANQLNRATTALQGGDNHVARALAELASGQADSTRQARLLDFLGKAWDQNGSRQETLRRELGAASGQLKAIEQILNRQDPGATHTAETLSPAHLVREGLLLFGKEELARVDIRFDPSMDHLPAVSVPRLPVIHVIYNLIANAMAAIEATGKSNGTIHVRGRHAPGIASIEITDDGIGIETAALASIFQAGYTTKRGKAGGEGLHWCANTLTAAGGRIHAHSDGIGRGASVTIELPVAIVDSTQKAAIEAVQVAQ